MSKLQVVVVLYPPSVRAALREVIELSPPAVTDGISREIFVHSASLNPTQQYKQDNIIEQIYDEMDLLAHDAFAFDKTIYRCVDNTQAYILTHLSQTSAIITH